VKKHVPILLLVVLSATLLCLAADPAAPIQVIDDRGQEIALDQAPQRIVAIGALYAQVVVDLGCVDRMVGIADSTNNPAETLGLPSVGPSFAPSVETILSLSPDLVLGAADWGGERPALESAGVIVLTTPMMTTAGDVLRSIATIGTAIGEADAAERLVGGIAQRLIDIESGALSRQAPRAAFLYMSAPNDPPYVAGSGSIEAEMIARAGGSSIFADVSGFPQVSIEELIARDPEVVFTDPAQVENVLSSTLLSDVTAVAEGRVIGISASRITSTGIADCLLLLLDALHPDR